MASPVGNILLKGKDSYSNQPSAESESLNPELKDL
jgi:hypothetical protein